ncbi:hypothetical protein LZQ00_05850 [Sphingobacterium sp. SRCM116780]|uniref:hypothetical protein n=1 Tax=Sphingobacterium sp. SRCM116780 TaxID=2907623 RepID=UPI001F18CFF9|nr:hypothetical protein [Sphingobacterium sp. SRCM116780]UIR57338.1 hypothetical protein LZQ00_05850 [Sphingobacterium sp. SRCM116780]
MNIATYYLLVFLLLTSTICCSQGKIVENPKNNYHSNTIRDSVFDHVIEISDDHVDRYGENFLFNRSIPKTDEIPVIFIQTQVPLQLLPTIYPEFPKIIVIVPNWAYYSEISNQKLSKGIACAEPMASAIIYEFNREQGTLLKDSIVIMGGFPKMNYAQPYKMKDNQKEIYYAESYGSVCCPRDQQLDNKPTREEFITDFEKENNVKIIDSYKELRGKEGEVAYFYTLKGLSNKLKLKFILDRNFYRIINRKNKDIITRPRIYTPTIIDRNERMEKIS